MSTNSPLVRLYVDSDENGHVKNASTKVSWCVEPTLNNMLTKDDSDLYFPHLIISTVHQDRGELTRQVVPLEQGSSYVTFKRGGENTIYAFLVYGPSPKKFKSRFKKRSDKSIELFDYDFDKHKFEVRDELFNPNDSVFNEPGLLQTHATVTVTVDTELFAKEPNKHLMFLANLWHETKLKDQCHFRRRFLIFMFLKIWPVSIYVFGLTVLRFFIAAFVWGLGFRDVNWSPVFHPWTQMTKWITQDTDPCNNYLIRGDVCNNEEKFRNWTPWLWPAAPAGWLVCGVPAALLLYFFGSMSFFAAIWSSIKSGVLIFTGVAVIIAIIVAVVNIVCWIKDRLPFIGNKICGFFDILGGIIYIIFDAMCIKEHEYTAEELKEIRRRHLEYQRKMSCPSSGEKYDGPKEPFNLRNAIVLWFQKTKAKVCRPFPE